MTVFNVFKKPAKKKKFSLWKLFAIIGAVVTIGAAAYLFFTKCYGKLKNKCFCKKADDENDAEEILEEEAAVEAAEEAPAEEAAAEEAKDAE